MAIVALACATRFNEAGADCPGMHRIFFQAVGRQKLASMRPGQTAPECTMSMATSKRWKDSFNEAGADCPGMRFRLRFLRDILPLLQ